MGSDRKAFSARKTTLRSTELVAGLSRRERVGVRGPANDNMLVVLFGYRVR